MGSHEIAIPLLDAIRNMNNIEISGIVSQPDKPSGRGQKLMPTKISEWANNNKINLLKPQKPDINTSEWIKELGCDLILVMAYGHILRQNILELAPCGIYNFHASILPKYRGASPIESAILNGETETGVTLMQIVPEMDAGDIVDIEKITIEPNDTSIEVYKKLANACPKLIERNLQKLLNGGSIHTAQNITQATFTKKFTKDDMQINFENMSAEEIFNRTRALAIRGNCSFVHNNNILKIGKCEPIKKSENQSNKQLIIDKNHIDILTKDGSIRIFELQKIGGKMLKINDFINGYTISENDII